MSRNVQLTSKRSFRLVIRYFLVDLESWLVLKFNVIIRSLDYRYVNKLIFSVVIQNKIFASN